MQYISDCQIHFFIILKENGYLVHPLRKDINARQTLSSRRALFCLSCGSGFGIKREAASRCVRCSLLWVMSKDR